MAITSALPRRQAGFQTDDTNDFKERNMPITVYAIYSAHCNIIYVGLTNDLKRRLSEHKRGHSKSTKRLKAGSGRRFLRELLEN